MVLHVHARLRMLGFGYICLIFFCLPVFIFFGGTAYSKLQVPDLNRGGWERRILLRSVPFGISSEALIGCGQFLCLGFRFSFLSLMIEWMHLGLLSHIRSFDTFPYSFYFQVLIIMAWHGLGSPTQLLDPIIFEDILSIFITNAVLRVIQG